MDFIKITNAVLRIFTVSETLKKTSRSLEIPTSHKLPSLTKNKDGKRDPEMRQTKKGNQYLCGMAAHNGVDA